MTLKWHWKLQSQSTSYICSTNILQVSKFFELRAILRQVYQMTQMIWNTEVKGISYLFYCNSVVPKLNPFPTMISRFRDIYIFFMFPLAMSFLFLLNFKFRNSKKKKKKKSNFIWNVKGTA